MAEPTPNPKPRRFKRGSRQKRKRGPSLTEDLKTLLENVRGRTVTFGEILRLFPRRSHTLMLAFCSFPLCLPVPIPVITQSLGLIVFLVAIFLAAGRQPWLPRFLKDRLVPFERLEAVVLRLLALMRRVEWLVHPRLPGISESPAVIRVNAILIAILAAFVSLPLPIPFSNMVAAVPIFLLSVGMLERDGYFVLAGYAFILPCFAFFGGLAWFGREAVEHAMHIWG
ncbi:MAG: exopolysaccharide biosynthesis protein [Candidatus Hydrogenedentes bacterium]|nr:exopolysaccharide biosynthesis protein [Candidatus Hydrogenedentota bacterium]